MRPTNRRRRQIARKAEDARGEEPARLKPEVAFADIKGRVPLPVAGAILKTFGAPDGIRGNGAWRLDGELCREPWFPRRPTARCCFRAATGPMDNS